MSTFQTMSALERSKIFMRYPGEMRQRIVSSIPTREIEELRKNLSPEEIAKHIHEAQKGSKIGPFGESLPSTCVARDGGGFGTYCTGKTECVECPLVLSCFCCKEGTHFEDLNNSVFQVEEERKQELLSYTQSLVGKKTQDSVFQYSDTTLYKDDEFAVQWESVLDSDGCLLIDKLMEVAGVPDNKGWGADLVPVQNVVWAYRFPFFTLPKQSSTRLPMGAKHRFDDVHGEHRKMTFPDFFAHCTKQGDTPLQVLTSLCWSLFSVYMPLGWRHKTDVPLSKKPKYVWSEYKSPQDCTVVESIIAMSGPF